VRDGPAAGWQLPASADQGHYGQDRDQEQERVNGDTTNHSDDQKKRRKGEKHAHLRIGFGDLPRHVRS
jgi:hypothetical protein